MRLILPSLAFLSLSQAHHVLFVHTMGTKSHLIVMKPLIEELLARQNKVTGIFFSSLKIGHENYTELLVANKMDQLYGELSKKVMEKGGGNMMSPSLWWWVYNLYKDIMKEMALDLLIPDQVQSFIRDRPKIDALLTLFPVNGIFAEIFDCPVINFIPNGPISYTMFGSGNEINHSIQPYVGVPFIEPMTFLNRLTNHAMIQFISMFMDWQTSSLYKYQKEFLSSELGLDVVHPGTTMRAKMALVIATSHPLTHGAWQYAPNIVEVGGLQLKAAGALPEDLQAFMDSATEGAVLVSFGSSLRADQMPLEKMQVFLDTFQQLGMKVVWKWDLDIPGLPDNILLSSWLPQQDLLAHPNLKVFVTHGGLGSLVEAIYHKAVIVGLPLSNDQKPNLLRAERHGYAVSLNWDDITAEELVAGIRRAMGDQEMAASIQRIHALYLDREQQPAEKAAWWVEYVCRHQGAAWLKPIGEDVPFYQHHHLDLILALTLALLICLMATFLFWRALLRCCCSRKTKTD